MDVSKVVLPPFWSLVDAHGAELLVHARRIAGDANGEDDSEEKATHGTEYLKLGDVVFGEPGALATGGNR